MTIYCTPFRGSDKQTTGPSTASGFETLDQVVEAMGPPAVAYRAMVIYGEGDDRVVFSRVLFCIDGAGTNA